MKKISLNGAWRLYGKDELGRGSDVSLSATVPGCVQLDLSAAGHLPSDLFMGENIKAAEAYESYEWRYERSFTAPKERKNVYLVFEGVDCLAEYFLNGVCIGKSDNMLVSHEFRVDQYLTEGENLLTVRLSSVLLAAGEEDYYLKLLNAAPDMSESRYIRKPPHSYGWDIMPRAVTAGLWREVRLEVRDEIYFSQAFFETDAGIYRLYYTLACDPRDFYDVTVEVCGASGEDSRVYGRDACRTRFGYVSLTVENPKRWYPYGYGEPNMYDGTLRLYRGDSLLHEQPFSFGIRSVELERNDGLDGSERVFRFLINGIPVMCRGTNWVPLDAFHSRDEARRERALALLKDVGCNTVRCWGGGVYEDHAFYDFCDRNGIMVWQDFAMACWKYPETDAFAKKIEAEATAVIRKLRGHPSIILWAGDNEVDACTRRTDPNSNRLTREVLPRCVELNDIGRPYLPSSPYISKEMYAAGGRSQRKDSPLPEEHLWGPRDYFKGEYYKGSRAVFVSETGYHGCPALASIRKFITPERVWPYTDNPEWILHSSDQRGSDARVMLMEKQVRYLFGEVPTDPERYILASQISQAEAKKYFIERIRVARPRTSGILWWNLLDGWPQMSDAVVDYYFEKKLAYHYIKRAEAPFAIAADEPCEAGLPIVACNDTLEAEKGRLTVTDAEDGRVLYEGDFVAEANTSTPLLRLPISEKEQRFLLFTWKTERGDRGFNHYICGLPPFSLERYRAFLAGLQKMQDADA